MCPSGEEQTRFFSSTFYNISFLLLICLALFIHLLFSLCGPHAPLFLLRLPGSWCGACLLLRRLISAAYNRLITESESQGATFTPTPACLVARVCEAFRDPLVSSRFFSWVAGSSGGEKARPMVPFLTLHPLALALWPHNRNEKIWDIKFGSEVRRR